GRWTHGLLAGLAGEEGSLGFVGAANRRERRRQEIELRLAERDGLAVRVAEREADRARLRQERDQRRAFGDALQQAVDDSAFAAAEARLHERLTGLRRAEATEQEARSEVEHRGESSRALGAVVSEVAMPLLGMAAPSSDQVRAASRAAIEML